MSEENTVPATDVVPNEGNIGEATQVENTGDSSTPEYVPNYKFKVQDSEHEFDEEFRGALTNSESEKKLRDLYEKAYGLEHIKPKYEKTKNEYQQLSQNWNTVSQDLQKVGLFLNNKDYGNFFKSFNLTDEQIMQYALERLQFHELPPEKQAQMQQQQSRNDEYVRLQQENTRLREFYQNQELSQLQGSLQQEINSPQVQSLVSQYDARAGKAGAFQNAVIHHANVVYSSSGKDMGAQEAVQSFINLMGFSPDMSAGQQQVQSQPAPPTSANRAPTLPKIQSSGGSHVKSKIRSIDDLKKLRDQITE